MSFTAVTLALAQRLKASANHTLITAEAGLWLDSGVRACISAAAFQRTLFVVFIALVFPKLAQDA